MNVNCHFILKGGRDVLSNVKSILIEINDDFTKQSEDSARILTTRVSNLQKIKELGLWRSWERA